MKLMIPNVPPLEVREIRLVRIMGGPVEWRFTAALTRDSRGGTQVDKVLKALVGGPVKAFVEAPAEGLSRSGPAATVVGASWQESKVDLLEVQALATDLSREPNPFSPRRRVHRVRTMRGLLEKFQNVCRASTGVLNELNKMSFLDGDHTSIVQDGVSDWEFVGSILDQCKFLRPDAQWLPLTLMGGVSPSDGTVEKWVVTPGCRKAYELWGDVDGRKLQFQDGQGSDGYGRTEFGSVSVGARSPAFPHGVAPSPIIWRQDRKLDDAAWQRWSTLDLPRFTRDGALIWKIEDRLYNHGQTTIEWESKLWTMPPEGIIASPIPSAQLRSWIGRGKVTKRSSKGYWLQTELSGFAAGENVADVRLTTPFSGRDGRKGFHMVPEDNTDIEVRWNGVFGSSLLLGANVRSEDTTFDSPSLFLEDPYTAQFADVRVPRIGQILVESEFGMRVQSTTDFTSSSQLQIKADGADLKMSRGTVYTGRGM